MIAIRFATNLIATIVYKFYFCNQMTAMIDCRGFLKNYDKKYKEKIQKNLGPIRSKKWPSNIVTLTPNSRVLADGIWSWRLQGLLRHVSQ